MALKQDFGASNTPITFATSLNNLASGSSSLSNEIDNSAGRLADDIEGKFNAAGTGTVNIYYVFANESGDYPSIDTISHFPHLFSVDVSASVPKDGERLEQLGKYYKILVVNDTTAATGAAGNEVNRQSAGISNA